MYAKLLTALWPYFRTVGTKALTQLPTPLRWTVYALGVAIAGGSLYLQNQLGVTSLDLFGYHLNLVTAGPPIRDFIAVLLPLMAATNTTSPGAALEQQNTPPAA